VQSSPSSAITNWLPVLVNQLDTIVRPFVLALDDYHLITEPAIHQAISFLLEHQPAQLHLAIATRKDPPLPLPGCEHADNWPNCARPTCVSRRGNNRLSATRSGSRTIGGRCRCASQPHGGLDCRLADGALSIRDRAGVSRLIAAFGGSHEYIVDYFAAKCWISSLNRSRLSCCRLPFSIGYAASYATQ